MLDINTIHHVITRVHELGYTQLTYDLLRGYALRPDSYMIKDGISESDIPKLLYANKVKNEAFINSVDQRQD